MKKVKYFGEKSVQGPCPAMMPEGDGYVCGLIKNPIKFIGKSKFRSEVIAKNVAVMIGAGNGCDDIGYNEDDFEENEKLSEMISKIRANPEYMANLQKSYEMIQKIRNGK
ncbi:hypothetical protein ACILFS_01075 [Capnocytophaga canimorsus]|uniref:hypothetical protein n=1 Tax=Capnocytophaga canimorsus TaxID=28188 RepID=UPI0037D93FF1